MNPCNKWDAIADITWKIFRETPFGGLDAKSWHMNCDNERSAYLDRVMEIQHEY